MSRARINWPSARWVVAVVLLTAASLKAYRLATQYVDSANLDALLIGSEGTLGIWLIVGVWPRLSWVLSGLGFLGFAAFNAWQIVYGNGDCGCLGMISAPPSIMLAVDLLLLLILWIGRPAWVSEGETGMRNTRTMSAIGLTALIVIATISLRLVHGDPLPQDSTEAPRPEAPETATTDEESAQPIKPTHLPELLVCDLGYVKPGTTSHGSVDLVNTTNRPLKVTSGRSNCTCVKIDEPKRIIRSAVSEGSSLGTSTFHITLAVPKKKGPYHKRVILRLDDPDRKTITIHVTADIGMPLKARPERLAIDSDSSQKEPGPPSIVQVINRGEEPIKLLYSTATVPGLYAEVPRSEVKPGQSVDFPVLYKSKRVQGDPTTHQGVLVLHTSSESQPRVSIPITLPTEQQRLSQDEI